MSTNKKLLNVTAVKVFPIDPRHDNQPRDHHVVALANIVLEDQIEIHMLKIMDGMNGRFVSYPVDPFYKGERFRYIAGPVDEDLRAKIEAAVLKEYNNVVSK